MTALTTERINELVDQVNAALLDSDWATLEQLVAPGVRVVGPRGRPQLVAVQYTSAPAE
jgi:hypothetical protein